MISKDSIMVWYSLQVTNTVLRSIAAELKSLRDLYFFPSRKDAGPEAIGQPDANH
jgi:hypothetical protein